MLLGTCFLWHDIIKGEKRNGEALVKNETRQ